MKRSKAVSHHCRVFCCALLLAAVLAGPFLWAAAEVPDRSLNLQLAAPIRTWDEAVPLGNGAMGVLLWGETNTLRLSLDRGDLWDERKSRGQSIRFNASEMFNFILGQIGSVAVGRTALQISEGRLARLNRGKGTGPFKPVVVGEPAPDCRPVYRNHGWSLRRYLPDRRTQPG